jgi:hypothetical protein
MGERLNLRLDAAYCAGAAVLLAVFATPAAPLLGVPAAATLAVSVGVAVWAAALLVAQRSRRLRLWLAFVGAANVVAAAAIGTLAAVRPAPGWVTLLLAAVAIEVGAFAVSQAVLLRRATRMPRSSGGLPPVPERS